MDNQNTVAIEWVVWESDVDRLSHALREGGTLESAGQWNPDADSLDEFGDSQIEPLMVLCAAVSIGWLAQKISNLLLEWKRPDGLLIDTRGGRVKLRPAPRVKRGSLVIVEDKGTQVVPPEDRDPILEALPEILRVG